MNQEVKEKWVSTLRSGEYKQGKQVLCTVDNEYCCLGVLCDLYAKEHNEQWTERHIFGSKDIGFRPLESKG